MGAPWSSGLRSERYEVQISARSTDFFSTIIIYYYHGAKGWRFETARLLFFSSLTYLEQTRVKKCGSKGTGGPSSREERRERRRERQRVVSKEERSNTTKEDGSDEKRSLIKWSTPSYEECGEKKKRKKNICLVLNLYLLKQKKLYSTFSLNFLCLLIFLL